MMLLLDPTPFARGLAGRKVEVVNYPDGRFAVRYEGVALPFRVFDKIQTVAPGAIVENKRLGAALAFARELQASYPTKHRRGDPRRQAAEQPGGSGYADKGPTIAQGSGSTCGRVRPPEQARCHFNFAQPMTFQPCGDNPGGSPDNAEAMYNPGMSEAEQVPPPPSPPPV